MDLCQMPVVSFALDTKVKQASLSNNAEPDLLGGW